MRSEPHYGRGVRRGRCEQDAHVPRPPSPPPRLRGGLRPAGTDYLAGRLRQLVSQDDLRAFHTYRRIGASPTGEEDGIDHRVPLSRRDPAWVPTAEVRGEGIFLQFSESAIASWRMRPPVLRRTRRFADAHRDWRLSRHLPAGPETFPGMRYVL